MKAYCVYPSKDPFDCGCVLVFSETKNRAKSFAYRKGPWITDYTDFRAIRKPEYDKYFQSIDFIGGVPIVETNDDLPDGVPPFFIDDNQILEL